LEKSGPCLAGATALDISNTGFQSGAKPRQKNNFMLYSKFVRSVSFFIITSFLMAGFFSAFPVLAEDYGLNDSAGVVTAYQDQISNPDDNFLSTKLGTIIGIVLSFVGVIFLILMIFAGLTWMTAQGSQEKVGKAKDLMINAVIGLIIVMAAYAITAFVGDRLI